MLKQALVNKATVDKTGVKAIQVGKSKGKGLVHPTAFLNFYNI